MQAGSTGSTGLMQDGAITIRSGIPGTIRGIMIPGTTARVSISVSATDGAGATVRGTVRGDIPITIRTGVTTTITVRGTVPGDTVTADITGDTTMVITMPCITVRITTVPAIIRVTGTDPGHPVPDTRPASTTVHR